MDYYPMYIDGNWCAAVSGATKEAINPATARPFATVAWGERADAQRAIKAANAALASWAKVPLWDRASFCVRMAELLEARVEELAAVLCTELGKPRHGEAIDEARETAVNFRNAAEQAKWFEGSTIPTKDPTKRVVSFRQPCGVIAVITPWNFPAAIASEYLPYAMIMGNTVVWTPAPTAAVTAVTMMKCLVEAGVPKGVLNLVLGSGPEVGDELVANPGTDAVAMTGSPQTGRAISARAGLKRRLLELGGNGPTVVLGDADPVQAAQAIAPACFYAAGQVCSSAERILVAQDIVEPFVAEMVRQARHWVSGDPQDPKVTMGPQNNRAGLDKIIAHIEDAIGTGAKVMVGGRCPDLKDPFDRGYFYEPTVLVGFTPAALINREETFGPVAPIAAFADETDADAYIAACDLGLVSAVFTRSVDTAWRWAEKLRSGLVVVNDFTNYWELHIPFGGATRTNSGVGRLGGRHTLEFMSDLKTIAFNVKAW